MTQAVEHAAEAIDGELLFRATEAYFSECLRSGVYYQQPASYSRIRAYDGQRYVVLENVNGPLAVYLVKNGKDVENLVDSWPDELVKEFHLDEEAPDILEAWAPGENGGPAIIITHLDSEDVPVDADGDAMGSGPGLVWGHYDEDMGWNGFGVTAADNLLVENGYRRVSPWNPGTGPRTDRQGCGNGYSCEVEKINEDAVGGDL